MGASGLNLASDGGQKMETETIWRYMDVPRFMWTITSGRLWFSKLAALRDDPYEGYCKALARVPALDNDPRWITHKDGEGTRQISVAEFGAHLSKYAAESCENAPDHLFVNSWCLSDESIAMWEIYGAAGTGVAIKSSAERYKRAAKFPDLRPEQYTFGKVEYHSDLESCPDLLFDFRAGSIPLSSNLWAKILQVGFHKRACFEYEREWRGALYQGHRPERGCFVDFDLHELISEVRLGPRAAPFLSEVVSSVMDKFGVRAPVEQSTLLSDPPRGAACGTVSAST